MRWLVALGAFAAGVSTAAAQHLVDIDPYAQVVTDRAAPTAFGLGAVSPRFVYTARQGAAGALVLPPVAPVPGSVPTGDATLDATTGLLWYTNGALGYAIACPDYTAPTAPWTGYPVSPLSINMMALAGPVTGWALDPRAGTLWLTDGQKVYGAQPVQGTPIVVPGVYVAGAPWVGMDWDELTGSLLLVNQIGWVRRYTPSTGVGGPWLAAPPGMVTPPQDVAIDKSGLPGPDGQRPVYVLAGGTLHDLANPSAPPLAASGVNAVGLAYHPYPAHTPPLGGCPCGGFTPDVTVTGPMTAGNTGFGITVRGLPAGNFVLFAFDFGYDPAFPKINLTGCPFGFVLTSPTIATGSGVADGSGAVTLPLPLLVPPGGVPVYNQNGTVCPADPTGVVLTPMMQLAVGGA